MGSADRAREPGRPRALDGLRDRRQGWMEQAACRGLDTNLFFPTPGEVGVRGAREAKAICACCPVQGHCLQYALDAKEKYGLWGGQFVNQRRAQRRVAIRSTAPSDSSTPHSEQTGVQK